jgi:hypothetical protein
MLIIEADGPAFYIKFAGGLGLLFIRQLIKRTFAARRNVFDERTGHIWGDRWSKVLEGEASEDGILAKESAHGEERVVAGGQIPEARPRVGPPGVVESHHEGETAGNAGSPPELFRRTALSHG